MLAESMTTFNIFALHHYLVWEMMLHLMFSSTIFEVKEKPSCD